MTTFFHPNGVRGAANALARIESGWFTCVFSNE